MGSVIETLTNETIKQGTVWRKDKLGTSAIYEVLRAEDELVEVVVREAPGVEPGSVIKLTRSALDSMQQL